MKNFKSTVYPLLILGLLLGSIGIGLGLFRFTVTIEPESPDISSLPAIAPPNEPAIEPPEKPSAVVPAISPSSTLDVSPAKPLDPADLAARRGTLRMSNPTEYPVRLALLEQSSSGQSYEKPAHWDFAPGEGGSRGLVLALPDGNLKLNRGDVLVAFAQDGSSRYWGPYVVGETGTPLWNSQRSEWLLILQP